MSSEKWRPFCLGLNVLTIFPIEVRILLGWVLPLAVILQGKVIFYFKLSQMSLSTKCSFELYQRSYYLPFSAIEIRILWGWLTSSWLWFHRKMIRGDSKVITSSVKCHWVQNSIVMMELALGARRGNSYANCRHITVYNISPIKQASVVICIATGREGITECFQTHFIFVHKHVYVRIYVFHHMTW